LNGKLIDLGEVNSGNGIAVSNGVVTWETNFTIAHAAETTPLLVDYDDFHPRPRQVRQDSSWDGARRAAWPSM